MTFNPVGTNTGYGGPTLNPVQVLPNNFREVKNRDRKNDRKQGNDTPTVISNISTPIIFDKPLTPDSTKISAPLNERNANHHPHDRNAANFREVKDKNKAEDRKHGKHAPTFVANMPTPTVYDKPYNAELNPALPFHYEPTPNVVPQPQTTLNPIHISPPSTPVNISQNKPEYREVKNRNTAVEREQGINNPVVVTTVPIPQVYGKPYEAQQNPMPVQVSEEPKHNPRFFPIAYSQDPYFNDLNERISATGKHGINQTTPFYTSPNSIQQPVTVPFTSPTPIYLNTQTPVEIQAHNLSARHVQVNPSRASTFNVQCLALSIIPMMLCLAALTNPLLFFSAALVLVPTECILAIGLLARQRMCCCW